MQSKLPLLHSCPGGVRKSTFRGPWRGEFTWLRSVRKFSAGLRFRWPGTSSGQTRVSPALIVRSRRGKYFGYLRILKRVGKLREVVAIDQKTTFVQGTIYVNPMMLGTE